MDVTQGALAYVFWHWPRPGTAADAYERHLVSFQERLRGTGADGLRVATTFRLGEAPWGPTVTAPPPAPVYEDWYVVTGFAALEHLKEAAVAPALRPTHDRAAAQAGGGTAGLYALRSAREDHLARPVVPAGEDGPPTSVAHWLSKPDGMSYAELEALLASEVPAASLWQRQMTLGPGAEFCLVAPAAVSLPADVRPRVVPREPLG